MILPCPRAKTRATTGIDFAQYDLDAPITYGVSNASQSAVEIARQAGWTRRRILEEAALGGRYPVLVGTGAEVATALGQWMEEGEIDGFNITRTVVPESYDDVIDHVVPVLQERGLYKTAYGEGSFRNRLFGRGDRLPDTHVGASHRWPSGM
ncbi:hypothetical protein [Rhizobium sp. 9140]|uniref:hypothetical protein n=1 Tax=Rhizobium sp. 9140 TaxID=1761900 RepID=UPI000B8191F2|nr:hypothetical protein [Rhizobium sp. 9140]